MEKDIRIEIRSEEESSQEFVKAWRRAEAGEAEAPVERLYFQDLETLLQVLTPRRLELLKVLHAAEPESVRSLARRLHRDNIYDDVQALERVGLIVRTADKRLSAPWEKVVAEINLAA
jgi:predicted transcriptional regulator